MMSITLRDYQVKLINDAREALKKSRGVLLCSPTGSGKTATNSFMTKSAADKGMITWFVVHRQELLEQSSKAFSSIGIPHSFVASGLPLNPRAVVQICSVMTLARRMGQLPPPRFIVYDECQYMGASTWDKIFAANPQAFHVGLSATPWRMDGKPFSKYFQEIVYGPSVKSLIDQGYLSDYKLYAPTSFDTSSINIRAGEYDMKQVELLITSNQIVGDYFSVWTKHAHGKKTIVFAPTIEASKIIVSRFMDMGVRAAHVDGETPKDERRSILRKFESGEITVISNIKLFTEGLDIPAIDCIMLCRPTRSLALYLQMLGRGLRTAPGKTHTIILDQVNACREHGLPDDEREWSLDGRKKKKKDSSENTSPVKICQTCFAANESFNHFCTNCGAPFEIKLRQGPEQVDGELEEIKKELFRKEQKKIQAQAKTLEDLIKIGVERNYKSPRFWAMKILESRKKR